MLLGIISKWKLLVCFIMLLGVMWKLFVCFIMLFRRINTYASRVIFFWKCSKFELDFENTERKWENDLCFLDICNWIGCVKLSLLRREGLPSGVNVLTNSSKIFCITKRDFSNSIELTLINKYDELAVVKISTVFGIVYNITCR